VTAPLDSHPPGSALRVGDRLVTLTRYLRIRPFDTETQEGRAAERYRRAAWSTVAAIFARVAALLATLATIPLALSYLGTERYGLWVTISSVTGMLVFADFGLGNGLMNAVSDAYGHDDRAAAERAVSSAFFMLTAVALGVLVVFAFVFPMVPWATALNVNGPTAVAEAAPTVGVFVLCFLINLPLGLVQRVQLGLQEGYVGSMWAGAGSVLGLVSMIVAMLDHLSLPWLVLALTGAPVATTALNALLLFWRRHADLRPSWRLASTQAARHLMRLGFLFFILQLAVAVAYQSDVVVAARMLGPDAAAEYAVVLRLFFLAPTFLSMMFLTLWPAYGEAIARGDAPWVRATLKRSVALGAIVSGGISLVLLVFGAQILKLWVGPLFDPPFLMLLGMAIWAVVNTVFNAISMLFNGASVIGFQVVVASTMAVTSIGASILLARAIGLPGIIWGTVLSYVVVSALPMALYLPRLLARLDRDAIPPAALAH
jgi:O-antigen/teichoic acid export membrane protein